jgi:hypothetical protein
MDGGDLESRNRVLEGQPRLRALLRRDAQSPVQMDSPALDTSERRYERPSPS